MNLLQASEWAPGKEGCFIGLPASEYHRAHGMSHSMSKHMDPPACLPVYLTEEREETADMLMGTLVHHMVLEPDRPLPKLAIKPAEMKFSTREGKMWRASMLAQNQVIITESDYERVHGMVASIANDPDCRDLIGVGHSEVSCFFRDQQTGIMRKMRLDWLPGNPANYLIDIKTVQKGHASKRGFEKVMKDQRYWTQASWYRDGWNQLNPDGVRPKFIFIAVEKEPPYLIGIHPVAPRTLEIGSSQNALDVASYAECSATGKWPGYADKFSEVGIADWMQNEVIEKAHSAWLSKLAATTE
jgi:exodeoxyribonuclease VIII